MIYSFLRFFSNDLGSGLGFHIQYESTYVSKWTYKFGGCGGSFSTPNGMLTSPSYPDNYPEFADCVYTISQPAGTIILLIFHSMDIHDCMQTCACNEWCCGYLDIRDGATSSSPLLDRLCGSKIPAPIKSRHNRLWMR